MASEDAGKSESFGSAAHLMIEALDKASQELEQTVRSCLDQVTEFSEALEKQLLTKLQKVVDQSASVLDTQIEELGNRREEFIERLNEFERTEIETVGLAAKEVRQQISARAQQATDSITRLVEEQMVELRALMDNPPTSFTDIAESKVESVKESARGSQQRIEDHESALEKKISERSDEFDKSIQTVIDSCKRETDEHLKSHDNEFETKLKSTLDKLTDIVNEAAAELKQNAAEGSRQIEASIGHGKKRLGEHFGDWDTDIDRVKAAFESALRDDRATQEQVHQTKLERKSQEVREEIEHIAQDATVKIAASHKLFYSSLKRLEKKYFDRLDRLFSRFENALSQEANLSAGSKIQSTSELRLILSARLQARGDEVVKTFQRSVEQIESEYVRASQGYHERIDGIRTQAIESLEKQMRVMAQEMERITRNFNNGLADLNLELPHIEERGRAAALAVKAYRSAMLSLGGD